MLPHLEAHLAEQVDSVTAYQLLFHEAAVANLLEVNKPWMCLAVTWHMPYVHTAPLALPLLDGWPLDLPLTIAADPQCEACSAVWR